MLTCQSGERCKYLGKWLNSIQLVHFLGSGIVHQSIHCPLTVRLVSLTGCRLLVQACHLAAISVTSLLSSAICLVVSFVSWLTYRTSSKEFESFIGFGERGNITSVTIGCVVLLVMYLHCLILQQSNTYLQKNWILTGIIETQPETLYEEGSFMNDLVIWFLV